MPTMSIDGDKYRVRIKWQLHGQACLNVLNFVSRGSQDLNTQLLQVILDCAVTHLLPILSNDVTLLGADVKNVSGTTAQEDEVVLTSGNLGGNVVDSIPSFNALVINMKTAHPGRRGRGKMFLLGIGENSEQFSKVDATFIAAAVAYIACLISAFTASDPLSTPLFHWSVFSRKDNQYYPITSAVPSNVIATMHSRKVHG